MSDSRAVANRDIRTRQMIKRYVIKTSPASVGWMHPYFAPDINLSPIIFGLNMNLGVQTNIEVHTIFPPPQKARYGRSQYDIGQYDPYTPIGSQIPDQLASMLMEYMAKHWCYGTQRGYKYSVAMASRIISQDMPTLEQFAPESVWNVRVRKIEGWRNWAAFYNLAMYNVNIYPMTKILIRVTDNPTIFGNSVQPRTVLDDQLSSNLYDHGVYDHSVYPGDVDQYPETWLMVPNTSCYEPLYNFANYNYDIYYEAATFDPTILSTIMNEFRQTQQPDYQILQWFLSGQRMQTIYTIHGAYQMNIRKMVESVLNGKISSPTDLVQYYAFALEYVYARRFMALVPAQKIIDKWVNRGLNETLLNAVAQITSR